MQHGRCVPHGTDLCLSEIAVVTSSIEPKEKAYQLHTRSRAEDRAFQLYIETMKPVHDDLIMESVMHTMAMKPVFKDIQSNMPQTY